MDQIDNNSNINIRQYINNDVSFQSSMNYQFFQQNNDENTSVIQSSNVKYEQNENEQIPMSIIYKKRIRTKFSQEQLDILEATFQQHRYPSIDIIDDLVEQLNLTTQKITVWFQNRRARLKKSQQIIDIQNSFEKDDQQHYDSEIHLDEDVSHDSSANSFLHLPPPPFMTTPSPYYLPNSFYNLMWSNFPYSLPIMANTTDIPYNLMNYNSSEISPSFVFQDVSNYQYSREFNDEL